MTFELDPILRKDSVWVGDVEGFTCRLINDSRYIWLIVVPTLEDITEIYQLNDYQQRRLSEISAVLGQELMEIFAGDKFNIAALGNIVRQLHVHHIVRRESDAAWPGPVWGHGPATPYSAEKCQQMVALLRQELSIFSI